MKQLLQLILVSLSIVSNEGQSGICNITGSIPSGGLQCFTFQAPSAQQGNIWFDTCGSSFDTILEVFYPTDVQNPILFDDDSSCGLASYLNVAHDGNYSDTYYLRIRPWCWYQGGDYFISYPCNNTVTVGDCVPMPDTTCDAQGQVRYLNWDIMVNDPGVGEPDYNFSIDFDYSTLSVIFDIDLEYIGGEGVSRLSSKDALGATYVIDFYSFGSNGYLLNEPGNCQNRREQEFIGITDFDDMWSYSNTADQPGAIGTNQYLAYPPPSDYWTLSSDSCSPVRYRGTFSWNDLVGCQDYYGNDLISVVDDGTAITLSGTLYVNIIAPYQKGSVDTGFYRSLPLVQKDFSISLLKQINVLASTGVDLFICTIIAIAESEPGKTIISVLTQTADYMVLINPHTTSMPNGIIATTTTEVTTKCLVASAFTCAQIFTILIDNSTIPCNDTQPADYSGNYVLDFQVQCRNATTDQAACLAFVEDNGNSVNIALDVTSSFVDETCVPELYQVEFTGETIFYDDDAFLQVHNPANGDYVIGQDQIYVEVTANFPDDPLGNQYDIFGIILDNVFVCTAPASADLNNNLNQQSGQGGCLSSLIDADGPYNIIINTVANAQYFAENIAGDGSTPYVRFSFLTFDTARTTIYVHTQLTLVYNNGARRRLEVVSSRRLLQDNTLIDSSTQIRHFIDSTQIGNTLIIVDGDGDGEDIYPEVTRVVIEEDEDPPDDIIVLVYTLPLIAWIIMILVIILCCCIACLICYKYMGKSKRKNKKSNARLAAELQRTQVSTTRTRVNTLSTEGTRTPITPITPSTLIRVNSV